MDTYFYLTPSFLVPLFCFFFLTHLTHTSMHAHACTHKHMHMCAYLIISQVSRNTYSESPSLEIHREKKAAFSVVPLKCSAEFLLMGLLSQWVCLGTLGMPVFLTLHPHPQAQNFSALSQHFLCPAILKVCCPHPPSTVSAHLMGGSLFILFVNTWWLQGTSYKWTSFLAAYSSRISLSKVITLPNVVHWYFLYTRDS